MNNRIQELAKQSGILTEVWHKDASGHGYKTPNYGLEKFAQLIVAECVTFLNTTVEVYTQAEQDACVRAACGLKNYFEIK